MGEDEARVLAEQLLGASLPRRWRHVQEVAAETGRLCDELDFDRRVVVSAAWLHDIGYAPDLFDTGFHPLDGARYLRSQHWDDAICQLVAHHTDAASQASAQGLGDLLSDEFAGADGLAHDILWTADATTGPNGDRMTLDERIIEIGQRYGPGHSVTDGMIASKKAIADAIARVGSRLTRVRIDA